VDFEDPLEIAAPKCFNSYVVATSRELAAVTQCNNYISIMGTPEQAQGIAVYLWSYMVKSTTQPHQSLPLLKDTMLHVRKYESVAEDKGEPIRTVKQIFQVMVMKTSALEEIGSTTACSFLLGEQNETSFSHDKHMRMVLIRPATAHTIAHKAALDAQAAVMVPDDDADGIADAGDDAAVDAEAAVAMDVPEVSTADQYLLIRFISARVNAHSL
jgi:hypothetical protein